jgi:hypothetical protein
VEAAKGAGVDPAPLTAVGNRGSGLTDGIEDADPEGLELFRRQAEHGHDPDCRGGGVGGGKVGLMDPHPWGATVALDGFEHTHSLKRQGALLTAQGMGS